MFLTIVDDYMRTTWLYLIKYKSQCVRFLTHFVSFVHNQFNSTVKIIRTDNAKELCEGEILNLLSGSLKGNISIYLKRQGL